MKINQLPDLLEGERLVAVDPPPAPRVEAGWFRRLHFHSGRHLTDRALAAEQTGRAGRLALMGQVPTPGIVQGLEATMEIRAGLPFLHVFPGLALARSGEDVVVGRPLEVPLAEVVRAGHPVIEPPPVVEFPVGEEGAEEGTPATKLKRWAEYARDHDLPEDRVTGVYFAFLQPVVAKVLEGVDPLDPCEVDPSTRPFEDEQFIDGGRLVLAPWPTAVLGPPATGARARSAQAYAIFEYERGLADGEQSPWLRLGVPLGLLYIPGPEAPARSPIFFDQAALARAGGRFQARRPVLPSLGQVIGFGAPEGGQPPPFVRRPGAALGGHPALWQARFDQWVDHLGTLDHATLRSEGLAEYMRFLPPLGVLPPQLMAVRGDDPPENDPLDPLPPGQIDHLPEDDLFPEAFLLEVAPTLLEDLDDLQRTSAPQAPIDLGQPIEYLQVLVPVPEAFYDPRLLVVERVDREFHEAIALYAWREWDRLTHRDEVALRQAQLQRMLVGPEVALPAAQAGPQPPRPASADPLDAEAQPAEDREALLRDLALQIGQFLGPRAPALYRAIQAQAESLPAAVEAQGLDAVIIALDSHITRAEDSTEIAWLKARSDLFRVHQQLTDNVVGTRMATSPAVGAQTERLSEPTTKAALNRFGPATRNLWASAENVQRNAAAVLGEEPDRNAEQPRPGEEPNLDAAQPAAVRGKVPVRDALRDFLRQRPEVADQLSPLSARLKAPMSLDVEQSTRTTKADLLGVVEVFERAGLSVAGLEFRGFNDEPGETIDLSGADLASLRRLVMAGNFNNITGIDEASFFGAGVRSLENVIEGLRLLDQHLAQYRQALAAAQRAQARLRLLEQANEARLMALDDLLAEVRHDQAVAQALLEEERERLRAINRRRRQIINDHVPFLIFRRPLSFHAPVTPPRRELLAGDHVDPLPQCLNQRHPVPEALAAVLELMREAPAGWFRHVPPLLGQIDRLDLLQDLVRVGVEKAKFPFPLRGLPSPATTGTTGAQLVRVFSSHSETLRDIRTTISRVPPVLTTWQSARREAEQRITLGDLMDPRHSRPAVATAAAQELEQITRVATCLYERFREVPAVNRLKWIDDLSQFDDAVDLRDLSVLEDFHTVGDRFDRADLQAMVSWLHSRTSSEAKATALMNAVIRVALLVASHAPTHALVTADLVTPRPALVGTRLTLKLDVTRVRVGMIAQLLPQLGPKAVGHGIIEDLGDGVATVRVEQVESAAQPPLVFKALVLDTAKAGFAGPRSR